MALRIKGLCPPLQVFDMRSSVAFYRDVDPDGNGLQFYRTLELG